MHRFIIGFIAVVFSLQAEYIPVDDRVSIGRLENGFVYYLQKNEFPREGVSIRLVVKVGSLHEEEEERGIAHFLEHMNFRGSENVEDWEMVRYLESVGAKFGADTNAYTSFTHTVYQLDLPKATDAIVEKGLFVVADFAGRATLDPKLIEKERKVIIDEYNLSRGVHNRLATCFFDTFCRNSLYNKRMPIGLKDVILHTDAQKIRRFYEKWYRPDRMALVVVGDCDITAVEGLIKDYFSYLEAKDLPIEEPSLEIEFPQQRVITGFIDEEMSEHTIGLYFFQKSKQSQEFLAKEELREGITVLLLREWLNHRFENLTRKNPPPFLSCSVGDLEFVNIYQIIFLGISYFEDRPFDALQALYAEIARAGKFGPTAQEFCTLVTRMREGLAQLLANEERTEHQELADDYVEHFLQGDQPYRQRFLFEHMQEILEEITPEDIRLLVERELFLDDFHIFFTASNEEILSGKKIEDFLSTLEDVAQEQMIAESYEDFTVSFADQEISYTETTYEEQGYTVLALQNGLKIILHPTDLERDRILFTAFAPGGKTLFTEEEYPALALSCEYMLLAGLGNLPGKELSEYLNEKNISYNCLVNANMRTIELQGSRKYFEDYCRLFLATFQERKSDQDALENLILRKKEILKQQQNNSLFNFLEHAGEILTSSHPFYKASFAESTSLKEVEQVLAQLFATPQEYTIVIVGDFSKEEVVPLLLSYLNSADPAKKQDIFLPPFTFPSENVQKHIYTRTESPCFNYIVYGLSDFEMEPTQFQYPLRGLCLLLQERLTTKMRQEMGETYACSVFADSPLYPSYRDLFYYFFFTCEEGKESLLREVLGQEIQALLEKGIEQKEIKRLQALIKAENRRIYQYNNGWSGAHQAKFLWNVPLPTDTERAAEVEQMVTHENLLHLAKLLFEGRTKVEITRCFKSVS